MVNIEDLYSVYHLARANKRRSEDAVLFEIDCEVRLYKLMTAINERTKRCDRNYTFVSPYPQPREVFGCEFEARMIHRYMIWRMNPIFERILSDRTYNNRVGMGTEAAINNLARDIRSASCGFTRPAYVIKWDLSGCFPNANCDVAYNIIRGIIEERYSGEDKEDLLWMAMVSIYAYPQLHYYRKSPIEEWEAIPPRKSLLNKPPGTGAALGLMIWQVVMNLYYDEIDHWAVDDMGLLYTRFMDDTAIVTENKEAALAMLPLFRDKYARIGSIMHPTKFYCQEVSKGVRFLGSYIKCDRIYIANRTLRKAKSRIYELNQCTNKLKHLEHFLQTTNSYIGLLKNKNEFKNIVRIWELVDQRWKEYVDMDWDRLCVTAKDGYGHNEYINFRFRRI